MGRWLRTLAVALAIPIVGLIAIDAADAGLEREWRNALVAQFGPIPADSADALRLVVLCKDPTFEQEFVAACRESRLSAAGRLAAVVGAVLSGALLAFIALTSLATKRDRRSLVRIFRPGLYLVLVSLTVLMVLDGAVVVIAAYQGESMVLGYVHPVIIFGVGLAVLVAAFGVIQTVVAMGRRRPLEVDAVVLDRAGDARLFELVDDAAKAVGTSPPDQIIAGLEPNFFVTESDVKSASGTHHGRTLYVSVAACRIVDREELRSVIGHELGHFKGEDTVYSQRFFPIYHGATRSLGVLRATATGLATIPLAAPLLILGQFFESFAVAERKMSRDRELAADAVGAKLTSPETTASALVKLHAIVPDWIDTARSSIISLRDGVPMGNVSARFADRAALGARASHFSDLLDERTPHPIDSHPPLKERLAALHVPLTAVADQAAKLAPASSAAALFGDTEHLEIELSEAFAAQAATSMGIDDVTEAAVATVRTAALTAAAEGDPLIARVVALFEGIRGPALTRPFLPETGWVALVDLEYGIHPEPQPFWPLVNDAEIPSGDQRLVLRVADIGTSRNNRIHAGTRFRPLGINDSAWRKQGHAEDTYAMSNLVVAVRGVGDWPVEQQLAGLFVVPASDPLAGADSRFADEIQAIGSEFKARPRVGE
jgi:Zn-dependent protease with chaperone function